MYLYEICMRVYSEDLRIQKVLEKFNIVSPTFEHSARVNEQARVFKSMLPWMQSGPCVIRPFNFRLKSKIENWCQFLIFVIFYHKKYGNRKYLTFFLLVEYWNITYIFTLIQSTTKRKIKLSGNFASLTMLQFVAWLSVSVFGESLKIENWKLQSIFNFPFSAKTFQIVDKTTQEGKGEAIRTVIFFCSLLKGSRKEVRVQLPLRDFSRRYGTSCVFSSLSSVH